MKKGSPVPRGRPPRILVVDDDLVARQVTLTLLRSLGHSPDAVESAAKAVEAVGTGSYGLVLMDLRMPGMDGLEATRRIRALPPPQPRIVAVTAVRAPGEKERCLEAGMDGYLPKSRLLADLEKALPGWLA